MKLKKEYRMTSKEKEKTAYLDGLFTNEKNENGMHIYLDPGIKKALPVKIKREIDDLYFKYLYPLNHINWYNPYEMELKDLKKDYFCGKNNNQKYWVKAYMLSWIANAPVKPGKDYFFYHLTSRESNKHVLYNIYE